MTPEPRLEPRRRLSARAGLLKGMLGSLLGLAGVWIAPAEGADGEAAAQAPPLLTGRLVFQRSTAGAEDARLWMYDFASRRLACLSTSWPLRNPINAQFSPDGRSLVFTAISRREERDIFLWKVGDPGGPRNLTEGNGLRDEDPRFSPEGGAVVFKQNFQIALMDAQGTNVRPLAIGSASQAPGPERSGPCFAPGGRSLVFWEGTRGGSDIYTCRLDGTGRKPLAAEPNRSEYYPVPWTGNRILYARWLTPQGKQQGPQDEKPPDQVWALDLGTGRSRRLPFNVEGADSSDPCPVNGRLVLFSRNRGGHDRNGYDLWLGDAETGQVWPLSQLVPQGVLVNSAQDELGATYFPGL